jgi:hypothetical protein
VVGQFFALAVEVHFIRESGQQHKENVMKFLSVYKNVERNTPPSVEEMTRMGKLVEEGFRAGWLVATEGCMPTNLGARVRQSNGKQSVTDGPFTESKEVIGGFAILQVKSKQEAIELTQRFLKVAGDGECELRQVYEGGADCGVTAEAGVTAERVARA